MKVMHNPIRAAALLCVAVTSVYLMWMAYRVNEILSSPEWCSKALQAERISSQNFGGLTACTQMLMVQLKSLATNSHILFGVIALCLLVLIVIVIAGGKLSFQATKEGVSANVGKDAQQVAAIAATQTAEAAEDKATEIREAVDFTIPPEDRP